MGLITKIEQQKNKNRVNIFVDDSFFCGLEKEIAVSFRLKIGKKINENELLNAVFESEKKRAFEKANEYLAVRMHSKFEITQKLKTKGFSDEVIKAAVKKLEEYNLINDDLFVKEFIRQNQNMSKIMLKMKLQAKGIGSSIIESNLSGIDENDEITNCLEIAKKLLKSLNSSKTSKKQQLILKLSRRGFNYDTIKKSVQIIENENGRLDELDFDDFDGVM